MSELVLEQLSVHYAMANQNLAALGPLSLKIDLGSFVSIIGPSGCGKSTLLRVLAGLLRPSEGHARFAGETILRPNARINILFQEGLLLPWRDLRENIALPLELAGWPREERLAAAEKLLPQLGLDGFARAHPDQLSGGMAQRAALGRALITQPDMLLLDEPFGALDALTRERLSLDLLNIWRGKQQTILLVTHDIQEATLLSDRVLVLSERPGRLVKDLTIPLPRPRYATLVYERDFLECSRALRAAIETEDSTRDEL